MLSENSLTNPFSTVLKGVLGLCGGLKPQQEVTGNTQK